MKNSVIGIKKNKGFCFWLVLSLLFSCELILSSGSHAKSGPKLDKPDLEQGGQYSLLPYLNPKKLFLRSGIALIVDVQRGEALYERKTDVKRSIASITKLMTAMVLIDAKLPMNEVIQIKQADRDRLRGSRSKLSFGTRMKRGDLLKIMVAGSDNRAAAALGRTFPGGHKAIVAAMNKKAKQIGLKNTDFKGVSGLRTGNMSTAQDLVVLVKSVYAYPLLRKISTIKEGFVTDLRKGWKVKFRNTNRLVLNKKWDIMVSKTGYIADSGHCLVMWTQIAGRPVIMVLLNSWGKLSKFGDSNRVRKWLNRADQKAKKAANIEKKVEVILPSSRVTLASKVE